MPLVRQIRGLSIPSQRRDCGPCCHEECGQVLHGGGVPVKSVPEILISRHCSLRCLVCPAHCIILSIVVRSMYVGSVLLALSSVRLSEEHVLVCCHCSLASDTSRCPVLCDALAPSAQLLCVLSRIGSSFQFRIHSTNCLGLLSRNFCFNHTRAPPLA